MLSEPVSYCNPVICMGADVCVSVVAYSKGLSLLQVMFSKPVPHLSNRLNAWVTALTCQWLMGPCKVNVVELPDGKVLPQQGVLVERYSFKAFKNF